MRDLTQHLTTRADDSHAAPLMRSPKGISPSLESSPPVQTLVRFFALRRIKPHAPPLVRAPVNSFEFQPCDRTPQAGYLSSYLRHGGLVSPTPSTHRLRLGLPGYLIPFAPLAFVPQRQMLSRKPPSPPMFLPISTHFTAPPGIPLQPLLLLKPLQYLDAVLPRLSPETFTSRLTRATCGPFTPSNSEQRLPPPYYRGCWHGVSRGLLLGYRHSLPQEQEFTTRGPSSSTRRRWVRLSPIAQDSPLLPPVGVWAVSQSQCDRPSSQTGYRSLPW